MRYAVVELHEYDPDNRDHQRIRWGQTYGEAPTREAAENIVYGLLSQPQSQPFEALGIFDRDNGQLTVHTPKAE